jgi:hypothetical protein
MLLGAALLAALAAGACDDSRSAGDAGPDADTDADTDTDADADTDTDPYGGGTLGAIEVTGNWDGAQPDGVTFDVAVFACPFTMPPTYYNGDGTIDADTGDVHALLGEIEPGGWCLMAYVDMNPDDGLAPVPGTDAVNATGEENANGAIAVDVVAGETTAIELVFEIQ